MSTDRFEFLVNQRIHQIAGLDVVTFGCNRRLLDGSSDRPHWLIEIYTDQPDPSVQQLYYGCLKLYATGQHELVSIKTTCQFEPEIKKHFQEYSSAYITMLEDRDLILDDLRKAICQLREEKADLNRMKIQSFGTVTIVTNGNNHGI